MTSTVTTRDRTRDDADVAAPTAVTTPAESSAKRSYLHHLDLIRATTFGLVIFIHVLTQTTDEVNSVGVTTTGLLLHFTRNAAALTPERPSHRPASRCPVRARCSCACARRRTATRGAAAWPAAPPHSTSVGQIG